MRKRGLLPSQPLVQSGAFTILKGTAVVEGAVENDGRQASNKKATRPQEQSLAPRPARREAYSHGDVAFIPARLRGLRDSAAREDGGSRGLPVDF